MTKMLERIFSSINAKTSQSIENFRYLQLYRDCDVDDSFICPSRFFDNGIDEEIEMIVTSLHLLMRKFSETVSSQRI